MINRELDYNTPVKKVCWKWTATCTSMSKQSNYCYFHA